MKMPVIVRHLQQLPRRLLLGLSVALALLIALGAMSYLNILHQSKAADLVSHTYKVVTQLQQVFSLVQEAESGQRGFTSTGNEAFLAPYYAAERTIPGHLDALANSISDNSAQQKRLEKLRQSIGNRMDLIRQRIDQRRQFGAEALDPKFQNGAGLRLMDIVRADTDRMINVENALLQERQGVQARARLRTRIFLIVGWLTSVGLLAAVFTTLVRQMRRAARAEEATHKSNIQLKEANNELRAFSYSVAHDLRAPLRSINGFSKVALEEGGDNLNEECQQALGRISANANMMAQLIDDLLALSKISYQPLRAAKVEMTGLAREVYHELVEGEDGRVIELEIADLPPAMGDASLLRQVWQNLIGNALKFTRRREKAHIQIGGTSAGPEFVTYFIRDNGAGFDMQYVGKLFGAFQRLHRPADFEGTGIGLALSQRIVQRHGGAIWAEGAVDEGARFAFTLPEWSDYKR
jgi:signal transduction histidine kinase